MKKGLVQAGLLCAACVCGPACAGDDVILHYEERAPYLEGGEHGAVRGLTGSLVERIFRNAGIGFAWELTSMSAQLHLLKENGGLHCSVGWYWTAERASIAKYSRPIYRDHPQMALVRQALPIADGASLAKALALPGLRVLVKANYSYGRDADAVLARVAPQVLTSPQPNARLADMLLADRADFMFISEVEGKQMLAQPGKPLGGLRLVHFNDIVRGEERFIVCTRRMPDALMARLNQAIALQWAQ